MARRRPGEPLPIDPKNANRYKLTLGDISVLVGLPYRLLQFWTDSRILLPSDDEHPGRGQAREFSAIELQIASMLVPLALGQHIPIGDLKGHAFILRQALDGSGPPQQRMAGGAVCDNVELRRVLDRAARGIGANFYVATFASDGTSIVKTVTDEQSPPQLDLGNFFPDRFLRARACTVVIDMSARLAPLFST